MASGAPLAAMTKSCPAVGLARPATPPGDRGEAHSAHQRPVRPCRCRSAAAARGRDRGTPSPSDRTALARWPACRTQRAHGTRPASPRRCLAAVETRRRSSGAARRSTSGSRSACRSCPCTARRRAEGLDGGGTPRQHARPRDAPGAHRHEDGEHDRKFFGQHRHAERDAGEHRSSQPPRKRP